MKLTALLSVALAALVAWIALRDYAPVDAERVQAQAAARTLGGTLVDRRADGVWRVRLAGAASVRCFAVDLAAFRALPAHGYTGLSPAPCRR